MQYTVYWLTCGQIDATLLQIPPMLRSGAVQSYSTPVSPTLLPSKIDSTNQSIKMKNLRTVPENQRKLRLRCRKHFPDQGSFDYVLKLWKKWGVLFHSHKRDRDKETHKVGRKRNRLIALPWRSHILNINDALF